MPSRAWDGSGTNKHNPSFKLGLFACISYRITKGIHVKATINKTITVLMSHSQICHEELILGHAWLNLWDKHMTTGRINQVIRNMKCTCRQVLPHLLSSIKQVVALTLFSTSSNSNLTQLHIVEFDQTLLLIQTQFDQLFPTAGLQSLQTSLVNHTPRAAAKKQGPPPNFHKYAPTPFGTKFFCYLTPPPNLN